MGGINKTLYDNTSKEPIRVLSQETIMNDLNIKDFRTLMNFVDKEKFPYFKIGRKVFTTVEQYNKWINNRMNNKY